jgi:hypothetical protein
MTETSIELYDNMKPLEAQSIAQAQQVLVMLFLEPSLTVEDACRIVNISKSKYYYWLSRGDEAISLTRSLIDDQQKQMISEIAIAKRRIIKELIADATDKVTKPLERAKLFEVLNEELERLQSIYNVRPGIEEKAQEFLKHGPTIAPKKSKFASIDIEETESGFRIGLNEEKDIIDSETKDLQDSENSV